MMSVLCKTDCPTTIPTAMLRVSQVPCKDCDMGTVYYQ